MEQTDCATIYALWNHGPLKGNPCMFPWLDGRIDEEVGLAERIEYVRNYMVRDGFVPVAWAPKGSGCRNGIPHAIADAIAAGRAIDLIDGKYIARGVTERGEPIETAAAASAASAAASAETACATFASACTASAALAVASPPSLGALMRKALERGISKTPTLDALENTRDPKRPPLPYFTERAQFDPFKGFVCKSSTQHQEPQSSFGSFVSPDMQDNGPQTNPVFGSAALVVKG